MYDVIDIAKYVIWYCKKNEYPISNLKLQKLLYFVQAQFLIEKGEKAFNEEIEAWDFGPVVPEAYRTFRIWGSAEIPACVAENADKSIYISDQLLIDEILEECAPFSAINLMEIIHRQSPWINVYKKDCNNIISCESIKEFFED